MEASGPPLATPARGPLASRPVLIGDRGITLIGDRGITRFGGLIARSNGLALRVVSDVEPSPEEVRQFAQLWWLPVFLGIVSIVLGGVVIAKPDHSLRALAVIVGIFILLDGIVQLVGAFAGDRANRGLLGLLGTVNLLIGIVLIRHPVTTVRVIALLIGLWLIAAAVIRLVVAFDTQGDRGGRILIAAVEGIFGIVIVASPHISFATLALLVGLSLIANGIGLIVFGVLLRTLKQDRSRRRGAAVTT